MIALVLICALTWGTKCNLNLHKGPVITQMQINYVILQAAVSLTFKVKCQAHNANVLKS